MVISCIKALSFTSFVYSFLLPLHLRIPSEWVTSHNPCPLPAGALEQKRATNALHALFHRPESQALGGNGRRIEPTSIIRNGQHHMLLFLLQGKLYLSRLAMTSRIGKRFLDDSQQFFCYRERRFWHVLQEEIYLYAALTTPANHFISYRLGETLFHECG